LNFSLRKAIRRVRAAELSPSQVAIVGMPLVAVVVGLPINLAIVRGGFEWLGLLRILSDISHRSGFWVLCLAVWSIGVRHAPAGHTAFSATRRWLQGWIAACASLWVLFWLEPSLLLAGSRLDEVACAILCPGLVLHLVGTSGSWSERWRAAHRTLLAAGLTFVGFTLVAYGYTMVKGLLFVICTPADSLLLKLDGALLGEHFYEKLAIWRSVAHPQLTRGLDIVYMKLFEQQWWSFLFFFGARDHVGGRRFILATFATYFIGCACYYIVPSLGPIYYRPELFSDCARLAPDSAWVVRYLSVQTGLTQARVSHMMAPFGFIAAFPSLHVGLALVVMLAMRRSLLLTLFNGLGALLTLVATVVLGWHYFVDGIFGLALGAMCWWLSVRAVPSASGAGPRGRVSIDSAIC
jgi:hypothetical protein